jgi:hypothetical protein
MHHRVSGWLAAACSLAWVVLPGCDSHSGQVVDTVPTIPVSNEVDATPPCPAGRMWCGSSCVDLTDDPHHCGRCGKVCASYQVCAASICNGELDADAGSAGDASAAGDGASDGSIDGASEGSVDAVSDASIEAASDGSIEAASDGSIDAASE